MKHLLLLSIFIPFLSYAAPTGWYIGVDAGYSRIESPKKNIFSASDPAPGDKSVRILDNTHMVGGLGESIDIGYNITNRFGINIKYDNYAPSIYSLQECSVLDNVCHHNAKSSLRISEKSVKFIGNFYQPIIGKAEIRIDAGLALTIQNIEYANKSDSGDFYVKESQSYHEGITQDFIISPMFGIAFERVVYDHYSIGFNYECVLNRLHDKKDAANVDNVDSIELEFKYYF